MELQKFEEYSYLEDFLIRNGFVECMLGNILCLVEEESWRVNELVTDGVCANRELAVSQVFVEIWNEVVETDIDAEATYLSNYTTLSYFLIVMIVKELKERDKLE